LGKNRLTAHALTGLQRGLIMYDNACSFGATEIAKHVLENIAPPRSLPKALSVCIAHKTAKLLQWEARRVACIFVIH
jgi:hypothetical protein